MHVQSRSRLTTPDQKGFQDGKNNAKSRRELEKEVNRRLSAISTGTYMVLMTVLCYDCACETPCLLPTTIIHSGRQ